MAKTKADLQATEMMWTGHQQQCSRCAQCEPFEKPSSLALTCLTGAALVREYLALSYQHDRAKTVGRAREATTKRREQEQCDDMLPGI